MRNSILYVSVILQIVTAGGLNAQPGGVLFPMLRSGISFELGVGRYSMRDEYFSSEKYSGTLPLVAVSWSRLDESRGFSIGVEHRHSPELRNNNISAGVTHFGLGLDYLYRVASVSLLSRDARVFVGPSTGFFMYFSELNIALSEFELPYSFAILLPLGLNSKVVLPASKRLQFAGTLRSSVFSLGLRMIDIIEDVDEEVPLGFLTPLSGTNARLGIGMRYALLNRLSLDLGYELQLLRIRSWDPLLTASDNIQAGLTLGF